MPHARLEILEHSGHLYPTEQPDVDERDLGFHAPSASALMRRGDDLRVADVIREHAAERGDATAIVHGERELSFAALDERSNRLAQALRAAASARRPRRATSTAPRPR